MSTTNGALRAKILASKVTGEKLNVPGWGVDVELRSMSIATKSRIVGDGDATPEQLSLLLPSVIIATAHDPKSGEALFTDDDMEWLKDQPAGIIEHVALAGLRVSGLDDGAVELEKKGS